MQEAKILDLSKERYKKLINARKQQSRIDLIEATYKNTLLIEKELFDLKIKRDVMGIAVGLYEEKKELQRTIYDLHKKVKIMEKSIAIVVPDVAFRFILCNSIVLSSGFTMWLLFKITGEYIVNPYIINVINVGSFVLLLTGLFSIKEWKRKHEQKHN